MILPGAVLAFIYTQALGVPLSLHSGVTVVAAFIIAWAVGYIVPGAPGGIGIREVILQMILTGVCNKDITLVAILLHRLASIIGDTAAFLFELAYVRVSARRTQRRAGLTK